MAALHNEDAGIDLRHYAAVLWRRRLLVASTIFVVVGAAIAMSVTQTPKYRSTAEVLLQASISEEAFSVDPDASRVAADNRVATEIAIMESRSVRDAVREELGYTPAVEIDQLGETEVVGISVTGTDAARAATDAQTYAEVFIQTRRDQLVSDLLQASTEVQTELDSIRTQIATAEEPLDALDAEIAETTDEDALRELESQRITLAADIERDISGLRSREIAYATQLDDLTLSTNITTTGGVQIVSDATESDRPVSPKPIRNAAMALFLGGLLGAGFAFLRDHYDDTISSKDDLEAASGNLPVLGMVPTVPGWKNRDQSQLVALTAPRSDAAEAYRTLRTSVQFIGIDRSLKVLQVTSPNASEGKTTTLANLAVSLARMGRRVVVVDCDLRRPRLHQFFDLDNSVGLTSVLLGEATLPDAVRRVDNEPRLAVLTAGTPPPNPSELLSARRTAEILEMLATESDYVLLDGPPVLPVTDSLVLATMVDGVVFVATADQTTRRGSRHALELLQQVAAPVIGTVLNGVERKASYTYQYGNYGYVGGGRGGPRRRGGRRKGADSEEDSPEARRVETIG